MKYATVCSGIGAPECAWGPLGWHCAWQSEIDPFPCAVLAQHYPDVPNLGDMTRITKEQIESHGAIDVLCGGTPCQSFSVAGLRQGLADPRGNLALEFLRIVDAARPRWVVWENVPGVLSSSGGRDFGTFLGALGQLGYGFAYRVLDAQYFGVPQRRRRVFVVGCVGDWRGAAAVLFERQSLCGNPAPRREAGENAPTIPCGRTAGGGLGTDFDCDGGLITHALRADGFDASEDGTGRGTPLVAHAVNAKGGAGRMDYESETFVAFSAKDHGADAGDIAPTVRAGANGRSHANGGAPPAVAFDMRGRNCGSQMEGPHDTANIRASSGGSSRSYVAGIAVRRLTPRECERFQGFPDDYTAIQYRGKPAADGPRYRAVGNSMAVPVMRWIGERIEMVESAT